jgi:hypothetical protein
MGPREHIASNINNHIISKRSHHLLPINYMLQFFKNGRVLKLFIIGMHGTVMYFVDEKILSFIAETAGDAT